MEGMKTGLSLVLQADALQSLSTLLPQGETAVDSTPQNHLCQEGNKGDCSR